MVFSKHITAIKELGSVNMEHGWIKEEMAVAGCLHLLVATEEEVKIILVRKESNTSLSV